jgi:hypothetical protein
VYTLITCFLHRKLTKSLRHLYHNMIDFIVFILRVNFKYIFLSNKLVIIHRIVHRYKHRMHTAVYIWYVRTENLSPAIETLIHN